MHPLIHFIQSLFSGNQQHPQQQNGPVNGHQPAPGYHNQAVQYDQAMKRGDFNNPIVAGPHAIDPKYFGYPPDNTGRQPQPQSVSPDITYNPNPHTNIPYSVHDPRLVALGNQYVANPTAQQFLGVDPAIFGFPADNTVVPPPPQFNQFRSNAIPAHLQMMQNSYRNMQ